MFAINLADWQRFHDDLALRLILTPLVGDPETVQTVPCEKEHLDGMGILLQCDDEAGRTVVDVIRRHYHRNVLRCYQSNTGRSWKRV